MDKLILALIALTISSACGILEPAVENLAELCEQDAFEVNSTEPGEDLNAFCRPDQVCTLRSAINSVNLCGGSFTGPIRLAAGEVYTLPDENTPQSRVRTVTVRHQERLGASALPLVQERVILEGNGATIETTSAENIIIVESGARLELSALTLNGGSVQNEGALELTDVTFASGRAGVRNAGEATLNNLTARGMELSSDSVLVNAEGATMRVMTALFQELSTMEAMQNSGVLIAEDVRVIGARGVELSDGRSAATVALRNYSTGDASLTRLTTENTTNGSVIYSWGTLSVSQSAINAAQSPNRAGGITIGGGAATITNTTIQSSEGPSVGGIDCLDNPGTTLSLSDVTLTGNSISRMTGAGGFTTGGSCELTATNVRLENNTPVSCGLLGSVIDLGGNLDDDGSCSGF